MDVVGIMGDMQSIEPEDTESERKRAPYRFINAVDGIGRSHLFVENVAAMLGCSVDFVRRIPATELPKSRIGQRAIYARTDVKAFIASRRDDGSSRYVPERKPADRPAAADAARSIIAFDPIGYSESLLKGRKP